MAALNTVDAILTKLKTMGSAETKAIKERFAISAEPSHGIFLKDLDALAKKIGKDDVLALALFETGIYEAQLLCSRLFSPRHITPALMEKWVAAFVNWEICDTFCMGFMGKSPHALYKAFEWVAYLGEYQKRAGFVLMVAYAFTDKDAPNDEIRRFFPVMHEHANDDRTYVMKGINWALRQVGKRNPDLHREAIATAHEILALGSKPARWIAKDALRQLQSPKVYFKNYPRAIYSKK